MVRAGVPETVANEDDGPQDAFGVLIATTFSDERDLMDAVLLTEKHLNNQPAERQVVSIRKERD